MAYNKNTWVNGDIITAEKLNNIEDGIKNIDSLNLVNGKAIHSLRGTGTAEENENYSSGSYAFAEGNNTIASGVGSHAEGIGSSQKQTYKDSTNALPGATTVASHVEGFNTRVQDGMAGHAEGYNTLAGGSQPPGSHAEGYNTVSKGGASHAEGINTTASGVSSHAEGNNTIASGAHSHAEGDGTTASGDHSHAEGSNTTTSEVYSHAEGYGTMASGGCSHAEGASTTASGTHSHAEGGGTTASGECSHAEGSSTIAKNKSQHVYGEYNIEDPSSNSGKLRGTYVEIVGNGTEDNSRSNARTLDWFGNESLQGSLTLGKGTEYETTIVAAQLKALLALLNA